MKGAFAEGESIFRGFLLLNILANDSNGRTATTARKITGRPKPPFPIIAMNRIKLRPESARRNAFKGVDEL